MNESHGNSKLSSDTVLAIYQRCLDCLLPFEIIAVEFATTSTIVRNIASKRNHRRLTDGLPDCEVDARPKVKRKPPVPTCSHMSQEKADEVRARTRQQQSVAQITQEMGISRHIVRSVLSNRSWRDEQ